METRRGDVHLDLNLLQAGLLSALASHRSVAAVGRADACRHEKVSTLVNTDFPRMLVKVEADTAGEKGATLLLVGMQFHINPQSRIAA